MRISKEDFEELMVRINSELADSQKPIQGRFLTATIRIFKEYNISGLLAGKSHSGLSFPVISDNLHKHVGDWYKKNYGDSLLVDLTRGVFPVEIDGMVFQCKAPLAFGEHIILASKGKLDKGLLNAVDFIHELPKFSRERMTSDTLALLTPMMQICLTVSSILKRKDNVLLISANSDITISCNLLSNRPSNPSLSSWHSLQFTEKVLKCFIKKFKEPIWTHDINRLKNEAISFGYEPDTGINWDLFKFKPDVRYSINEISRNKAVMINHEAWRIAWNVLHQL